MYTKKTLNEIIKKGNKEDMDKLGDSFVEMVYALKETDPIKYKSIKYDMHKMAYGEHLTEEQARHWVDSMENADGTTGEHWTYEQTETVRKQYAPDTNPCDFYAVLNMVYSDYYNPRFDTSNYIELAKDWINDKDVPAGKTLKYYMFVVK